MSAEHSESVALRELIDEQRSAMRLDVGGKETFEFVVVVLDAFREVYNQRMQCDGVTSDGGWLWKGCWLVMVVVVVGNDGGCGW